MTSVFTRLIVYLKGSNNKENISVSFDTGGGY